MKTKTWFIFFTIVLGTFFMDWILGALCASGILSLWVFLLANIPFGGIYVWMESSWKGTHYVMLGHSVGDIGSLGIFAISVFMQGCLYFLLWTHWYKKYNPPTHTIG